MISKSNFLPTLLLIICFQGISFAQGDLMIMPKRIVFDGSQRSQEVNLVNTGSDSATYAISFIQYKMKEDGGFEQINEPEEGQRFANDFLRYYPRRVSLGPNEAQTLKVQVTRTGNLENGEYRSHLYFRAVEKQTALGSEETSEAENNISINIKTVFGISIPVIIRNGKSSTVIELNNIDLDTDNDVILSMDIHRKGNMSVYGNLSVKHIVDGNDPINIGIVKGIAIYTPNKKREFSFILQNTENVDLTKGVLEITYESEKGEVFARTIHELD
ncbi:fimbria/pilus periplasmic chaperone [Gramella sp. MAR_2010_147]|uniref:fimbrial biogenesis chaperone n=1 Tax=Gramella sp. MAR_2010_147 TaxID=1250205 RepID=UPI000B7CED2E|nr:fimbria/pilus periplasmic chaperone [Gramella sp. MAR_2010_147]